MDIKIDIVGEIYCHGIVNIEKHIITQAVVSLLSLQNYDSMAIFYTGHGCRGTGDWFFPDASFSYEEFEKILLNNAGHLMG
jgi:hypothetical protein